MKTKKSIILVVCLLFALMTFFVACDRDKTQKQLVDMYGVVKNPIADPNPYNEWDQKRDIHILRLMRILRIIK